MDGDFAPMTELAKLRKKHGFLLVIDDAHATFVCGKTGGGAAEKFDCETCVDICIDTLSKAAGCQGGFIACSKKWKLLIQSRGRSFIFSTSAPVPVVAAAHAAVVVAKNESWRRQAILNRVQEFRALTGIPVVSHIISIVVGSEDKALQASRLRVTLSAAHTKDDLIKLTSALFQCISFKEVEKKIGKLMTPNEEERERTNIPLIAPTDEFKSEKVKTRNKQPEVQEISTVEDAGSDFREKPAFISSPSADQKAAKIQRLKSGFRICKPQGTFLWPNMVKNYSAPCANMLSPQPNQVLVQVDVPTPPSVSSSTASAPPQLPFQHLLHPSPPVKPFAERGAVAVSLPTVPKGTNFEEVGANIFSTTTVINLKNVSKSPNHAIPLMSTAANIKIWEGCVYGARNAMEYVQKQKNVCCSSSASSLASEVGNWLALSAPKSGLSDD